MTQHKKQLHQRIIKRQSQLQAELEQMVRQQKPTRSERERALAEALTTLDMHLATGWENVDGLEAGELSRWLDSTQFLVADDARPDQRADGICRQIDAQWTLEQYGVPAPEPEHSSPPNQVGS